VPDGIARIILDEMEWEGNVGRITRQLDRPTYVAVNKVLELLGGKWNRAKKGHVFEHDPRPQLRAIEEGEFEYTQYDSFYTPHDAVRQMVDFLDLGQEGFLILEPSAGDGRILDEIGPGHVLECCEIDPEARKILSAKGYMLVGEDFLEYESPYDRIVMNPPWSKYQWVDHVRHALELLRPGGRLVALVPDILDQPHGVRKVNDLIQYLQENGEIHDRVEGFEGTAVKGRIVTL